MAAETIRIQDDAGEVVCTSSCCCRRERGREPHERHRVRNVRARRGVLLLELFRPRHLIALRILRMLTLFGFVEARTDPSSDNRLLSVRWYRKTALYDRLLSFDVTLERSYVGTRH